MNELPSANPAAQRRLGLTLAVSLLLHLGVATGLGTLSPFVPGGTLRQATSLHVQLRSPTLSGPAQTPIPAPIAAGPSVRQAERPSPEQITPARFITEPDLDILRDIPVSLSGRIHFRLHVSSLGTISSIEVIAHDPLPIALLDGLKTSLAQTRLHPAEFEGRTVASTLDITVGFDPVTVP
ncbi:MAG: hypothetical protein Q7S85_07750 [Rugosibacter sp.]|nr:hypothetical protein [Rugosibacter sp.]